MAERQPGSFEQALNRTEQQADQALKAAEKLVQGLKSVKSAAQKGELRKLRSATDAIRAGLNSLEQQIENTVDSWQFDEDGYLRDGYTQELLEAAKALGLALAQQDDRLYTYPLLIAVDPARRAVTIDKKAERRINPALLVEILRERAARPARFKADVFLKTVYAAYMRLPKGPEGAVLPLVEVHNLLTLIPSVRRDYSLQEFTRDIYLLDDSGVTVLDDGTVMGFHASTGTRLGRGVLHIVTKEGAERRYWGISFSNPKQNMRDQEE